MKYFQVLLQVLLLCGVSVAGNQLALLLPIKIPGSIVGILIVFLFLKLGWLPLSWIEAGATLLVSELLLFFVPSVVGIINFSDILWSQSFGLLAVIVASTLIMLAFIHLMTGLLAQYREEE
ncbi:CidA/LrgA family protein [Propionispora hippei]|uniref:Holin-like protein n=1 Tax=Propionispora hippei DSM 15287 TaxID=1123003 RepID=A0A1M6NDT6_9FIRM|nr:CidA/LrgA family protein [Propionispora hippei]SHJ93881.1 holin-like protein [Propionispora hippei DSM 15287]